jgi:hypothetical protein
VTTFIAQPNATSGVDAWIASNAATSNYGTHSAFHVGEDSGSISIRRGLVKFDLSGIPSNAVLTSAILSLWKADGASSNTRTYRVYRTKRVWTEAGVTYNKYDGSNDWQTAGGFGANDCEQTDIGSLSLTASAAAGEKQFTLTVASIQTMITGGAWTNNGFLVKVDTESADLTIFYSSDHSVETQRPKLTIEYDLPGEVELVSGAHTYGDPPTPAYTQMADIEGTGLDEFTGSSGGVAQTNDSEYAGTYGITCTLSAAAAYVYWTNLGGVKRCVTELMFDPNSATIPNFIPIAEIMNTSGDGMFRINVMKSTGQSTYTVAVSTHQYTRQSSYALGSENNVWSMAKWFYNMTDAYHKIRINCNLFDLREPAFEALYGGEIHMFVDDVFVGSITRNSGPSVGLISKTRKVDGGFTQERVGVTQTPPAGLSGTMFFDNIYEAATYSDLAIPQRLITKSDKYLFHASAEGDDNWIEPRIIELVEGSTGTITVEFDTGTVTAANVLSYRNRRAAQIFPASACSVSENVVTTPAYGGLVGNNNYTVEISAIVDGRTIIRRMIIQCKRHGSEQGGTFVSPASIYRVSGSSETFEVVFEDAEEVSAPAVTAYRGRRTLTSTVFPNGSSVAAGNSMITPTMTGLVGGQKYVLEFAAVVDGYTTIRKALLRVHPHGGTL